MKRNSILLFAYLMILAFGIQNAPAQITITIPKLPKIKKPKIEEQPKREQSAGDNQTNQNQTNQARSEENQTAKQNGDDEKMDFRLSFFLDEIAKAQKSVDEYTPETKIYLVFGAEYEWLERAVSPKSRAEFYEKWKTELTPNSRKKFDAALDRLNASAAQKMPLVQANPSKYVFRNAVEEKMMKSKLDNLTSLKIYKIGLNQSVWLIDKNSFGIPTARYKHGMIWARDTTSDQPHCMFYYINIIQDYAGGGTYGASYARFISGDLAGCPAGAK